MRPRIFPNRRYVKWLPASWSLKNRACRTRRPPVLEEPLLRARQGPVLAGDGQGEPEQEIPQFVGAPLDRARLALDTSY